MNEHVEGFEEQFKEKVRGYFVIDEETNSGFHFYYIDNFAFIGCITSSDNTGCYFAMNFLDELSEKLQNRFDFLSGLRENELNFKKELKDLMFIYNTN